MKTRIIHTQIHLEDDWFNTLSIGYRYLYIYMFTNSHIGLTGAFHLTKRMALLETGATEQEWIEACKRFDELNKVKFPLKDWIVVLNVNKYANYTGEKNEKAYEKEYNLLPKEVRYCIDTLSYGIDTSINHKYKIINNKSSKEVVNKEDINNNQGDEADDISEGFEEYQRLNEAKGK